MEFVRDGKGVAQEIEMRKPYDMHQHLRDGAMLQMVAPMVAKRFTGAIVMPNTVPPITTWALMLAYKAEILAASAGRLAPLMTFYLTDTLGSKEVRKGLVRNLAVGVKYYPRGITTNSDSGVKNPTSLWTAGTRPYDVLRVLADNGGVLLLHAADVYDSEGNELDPYDQEKHFINETLPRIIDAHPDLKISVEHLSSAEGVQCMRKNGGERLGCSITAQHLLLDRRDVFRGGFRPHRFWWPIIQSQEHKEEIRNFVSEAHSFVWLGSDSAPHSVGKKETDCSSGGVLMAHAGIELYVEAFEDMGCLELLEDFASVNGPLFYGIDPSDETIMLVRQPWKVDQPFFAGEIGARTVPEEVIPFRLGEMIRWKLVD